MCFKRAFLLTVLLFMYLVLFVCINNVLSQKSDSKLREYMKTLFVYAYCGYYKYTDLNS